MCVCVLCVGSLQAYHQDSNKKDIPDFYIDVTVLE